MAFRCCSIIASAATWAYHLANSSLLPAKAAVVFRIGRRVMRARIWQLDDNALVKHAVLLLPSCKGGEAPTGPDQRRAGSYKSDHAHQAKMRFCWLLTYKSSGT